MIGEAGSAASEGEVEVEELEQEEVPRVGIRALVRRKYRAMRGQRAKSRVPAYSDTPYINNKQVNK